MNRKLTLLGSAATLVIVLDQLTKAWIRGSEAWQYRDLIEGWLAFHYINNPGMAMGIDFLDTRMVSILALLATVGISIYVLKNLAQLTQGYALLMGFINGFAVFPYIFNVADMAISTSVVILLVFSKRFMPPSAPASAPDA
jgi:signal peptidase II